MKTLHENRPPEEFTPKPTPRRKKTATEKWLLFSNLMTIPALAFYYYVGLNGHVNRYFVLLILMLLVEYTVMRRTLRQNSPGSPSTPSGEERDSSGNRDTQGNAD